MGNQVKLKQSDTQQIWLQFVDGRQIQIHKDAIIEVSDNGLLVITLSDYQATLYPPHAWSRLKVNDPAGQAAAILLERSNSQVPYGP